MNQINEVVLIDTSVWIAAFRGTPQPVAEITKKLILDDLALTCSPVLFEIRRGLRASECERIMSVMHAIVRFPMEEEDWELAGTLDASLRSRGITIPPMDVLIAQVCLKQKIPIFTLDKHFEGIENLKVYRV